MAYLAGMIWSVSMLTPNFQAFPRRTLGNVMAPNLLLRTKAGNSARITCDCAQNRNPGSCDLGRQVLEDLARVSDHARHRARGRDRRIGEVHLRLRVPHAAGEIAIGGAQAHFAVTEHSHVPAQARAAGGGRPRSAGGEEGADEPFLLGLDRDLVRGRRNDQSQPWSNVAAL